MSDELLYAALEMLRQATRGDYRPEFHAAVKRLNAAVCDAAAEKRERELSAAPVRIDFMAQRLSGGVQS